MTRVGYIAGLGRSGSTLVERIAARLPEVCVLGEVVHLWERGIEYDELCSCGNPFSRCPFWQEVGAAAFGSWDKVDLGRMRTLATQVDRTRFIPAAARTRDAAARAADMREYADHFAAVYAAATRVSGARVVMDSSKHPSTAYLLRRLPGLDLRVIHLVRDSRGVAYSWTKEVKKPEVTGDDAFMPQYSPSSSGRQWVAYNLLFDALGVIDKTLILRYEALMAEPRASLERILEAASEPVTAESFAFLGDGWVDLGCDHTVAGNPMRFHQGRLDLRLDQAWTTRLPERDRKVVTAITWPLQLRYGYSKRNGHA
jgi:hypothetical protein